MITGKDWYIYLDINNNIICNYINGRQGTLEEMNYYLELLENWDEVEFIPETKENIEITRFIKKSKW